MMIPDGFPAPPPQMPTPPNGWGPEFFNDGDPTSMDTYFCKDKMEFQKSIFQTKISKADHIKLPVNLRRPDLCKRMDAKLPHSGAGNIHPVIESPELRRPLYARMPKLRDRENELRGIMDSLVTIRIRNQNEK